MWKNEEERRRNVNKQGDHKRGQQKGKKEGEKGEDEMVGVVGVKKGVSTLFPVMLLRNSVIGRDSESCGNSWRDLLGDSCGLSDCVSEVSSGVPVVTDVPVSPSVVVMSAALASDSDSEFVEPQSFSFSKKPSIVCVENQAGMSHEGNARKSATDIQKKSDAAHATAELVLVSRGHAVAN